MISGAISSRWVIKHSLSTVRNWSGLASTSAVALKRVDLLQQVPIGQCGQRRQASTFRTKRAQDTLGQLVYLN